MKKRAFPVFNSRESDPGMNLRDYFAAQAIGALVRVWGTLDEKDHVAVVAYQIADEMMKERGADD